MPKTEEIAKFKVDAMAAMFDAGFNLSLPVLVHKRPVHAWSMKYLEAIFNETHQVLFIATVKHPLDVKPETYGCDPLDEQKQSVVHNLAECYSGMFEKVLPFLCNYLVVRAEDWFLHPNKTLDELWAHVGLSGESPTVTQSDDDFEGTARAKIKRTCKSCASSEDIIIDYKYFGECQEQVENNRPKDWHSILDQLGYPPDELRDLPEAKMRLQVSSSDL